MRRERKKKEKKQSDRQCVHFAFKKATLQAVKDIISSKDISLQKLFESYAEALAKKDPSAIDLFNRIFLQETIKVTTIVEKKNKNKDKINPLEKLDDDALYSLIGSNNIF